MIIFKFNNIKYDFSNELTVKIISPNFSLENYQNQTEIFQQISDLIEPEEIVEEIESITKGRINDGGKSNEKPQL